jgi:hypothetical protein
MTVAAIAPAAQQDPGGRPVDLVAITSTGMHAFGLDYMGDLATQRTKGVNG